jgi:hypothetical protein
VPQRYAAQAVHRPVGHWHRTQLAVEVECRSSSSGPPTRNVHTRAPRRSGPVVPVVFGDVDESPEIGAKRRLA